MCISFSNNLQIKAQEDILNAGGKLQANNDLTLDATNITNLIASQIIANEAQITTEILNLMSKKELDYEDHSIPFSFSFLKRVFKS